LRSIEVFRARKSIHKTCVFGEFKAMLAWLLIGGL